jgi:hypothetical protein
MGPGGEAGTFALLGACVAVHRRHGPMMIILRAAFLQFSEQAMEQASSPGRPLKGPMLSMENHERGPAAEGSCLVSNTPIGPLYSCFNPSRPLDCMTCGI